MYNYISPQGVIVPDTAEIKLNTENEWKAVWGADLDVSPETPQGVLIASDVAVRSEVAANNAALANQINPDYAGGVFLDDIWSLTGGKRRDATFTLVDGVLLGGFPGVTIPSGSRRATLDGGVFQLLSTVTLDAAGQGVGIFQALEAGPIACPTHALSVPVPGYTSVGWETSDNPAPGFIGRSEQSDLSAKQERRETLAIQGRSLPEAVSSRVRALDGVLSLSFRENFENFTQTIDGITLVEHSIWVCVDGGSDQDIAEALYKSKSGGCNYNGATVIPYQEPLFGQMFNILIDRPTPIPIMVKLTGTIVGTLTGDPESIVKQAIMDYASGNLSNGEVGFTLGTDVSPFEIASGVNHQVPVIFTSKLEIAPKSTTPVWTVTTMAIGLKEKATLTFDDIQVVLT